MVRKVVFRDLLPLADPPRTNRHDLGSHVVFNDVVITGVVEQGQGREDGRSDDGRSPKLWINAGKLKQFYLYKNAETNKQNSERQNIVPEGF